jgi:asparagine synthetase B (glutamine-hydrolysing)
MVATGLCPTDIDWVSACSIITVGWSLEGKSLLRAVNTCRPWEYLTWQPDGTMKRVDDFAIKPDRRIDPRNRRALRDNLDEMVETALSLAKTAARPEPSINLTLSSGLDSRAVLALLLSVYDASKITCVTAGGIDSLNVRVARRLATWYGTGWRQIEHNQQLPSLKRFFLYADALAFAINGDVRLKDLATKSCAFPERDETMVWHGDGGEQFSGGPVYKPFEASGPLLASDAMQRLLRWFPMETVRNLINSAGDVNGVIDRFEGLMHHYADQTTANGWDLLDLFFLYERSGVSRARKMRGPHALYTYYPYYSQKLLQLAFRMPPPIANYARIHEALICRRLLKAYWVRINGIELLPMQRKGLYGNVMRRIDRKLLKWQRLLLAAHRRPRPASQCASNEELRAVSLLGALADPVRQLISAKSSLSTTLFGEKNTNALFDDRRLRWNIRADLIGNLIAMERWYDMVKKAERGVQNS